MLLEYDERGFHEYWVSGGCFSDMLRHDDTLLQGTIAESIAFDNFYVVLKKKREKFRFAIHPKVLIKPFILIEKWQSVLDAYQAKRRLSIRSNQPFQLQSPSHAKTVKKSEKIAKKLSKRTFWLNPYHNRLYGLHMEIRW